MEIEIISILALMSAAIAIALRQKEQLKWFAVFKPLTTILIIIISILVYGEKPDAYSAIMMASLVLALIGDVFLIYKRYFIHGLFFFLLAQIGFTLGFVSINGFSFTPWPLLVLVPFGIMYYRFLSKDLHQYAVPVGVYIPVILLMNWQATALVFYDSSLVYWAIGIGSLFFTFSDSVIAYTHFKRPFSLGEPLILSTYWLAIYVFTIAGLYH